MRSITFQFEGLPPSYNKSFKINYNFREVYLTEECRTFKTKVKFLCPHVEIDELDKMRITIMYNNDWHYKNGKIRRKDIQNLDKLLIDALAERLNCDDSQFFEVHLFKIQSDKTFTVINIEVME
ncbi:MAG: RusA family crossover junction endodeoxyribonuclease [Candidatus Paceibacterota bacterium]